MKKLEIALVENNPLAGNLAFAALKMEPALVPVGQQTQRGMSEDEASSV